MIDKFNPYDIQDLEGARTAIALLLNLIEEVKQENQGLREENQRLRDENNRLKGEQGKPNVRANKKVKKDQSSEKERQRPQKWHKSSKIERVVIDREEVVRLDKRTLPDDAQFKGYETVVVQELKIETDNVRFYKEKYYSPSKRQTYLAPLPAGYAGQFGPTVRALVIAFHYAAYMTEPKIVEVLGQMGTLISEGEVSNLLIKKQGLWQAEATEVLKAGLASSSWQHMDDTATRVNGVNQHCHVLCNPFYTWYATRPQKDRLTVIAILQNSEQPVYQLNEQTHNWLTVFAVPQWAQQCVRQWPQEKLLAHEEISQLVSRDLAARLNEQQQARVLEAAALTAYYNQSDIPIVPILVSDDAPQFSQVTEEQGLCWVHEGRHYKKLTPFVAYHQALLAAFLTQFWRYYDQLQQYRAKPSPAQAERLSQEFDDLFSQQTGYDALDKRIAITRTKKEKLLTVLAHPEIPLHNNPAELAARQRVRKRDISFGPRTDEGRTAWDTFMTLAETAKKLDVSFYQYVFDRVSGRNELPALADILRNRGTPTSMGATS
jgi:regulator of replication initiation timing